MHTVSMTAWRIPLLVLTTLLSSSLSNAQGNGRCAKETSRTESYAQTYSTSSQQIYYVKCGWLNILKCTRYRTVYAVATRTAYRLRYFTEYECCPGWLTEGSDCVTTPAPTTTPPTTTTLSSTTIMTTQPTTNKATTTMATTTEQITLNEAGPITPPHSTPTEANTSWTVFDVDQAGVSPGAGSQMQTSPLSNTTVMMLISCGAVLVFLIMTIGGVVCAVKRFCPKKRKHAGRLEDDSPTRMAPEGFHKNGAPTNPGGRPTARTKDRTKARGQNGRLTATCNPGYDFMALDDMPCKSSYEGGQSGDGHRRPPEAPSVPRPTAVVAPAPMIPPPGMAKRTHEEKTALEREAPPENSYASFEDDAVIVPAVPRKPSIPWESPQPPLKESPEAMSVPQMRKPLPKPKPMPKARRNPPPSAACQEPPVPPRGHHALFAPAPSPPQYLDMSKGNSANSSPTMPKKAPCRDTGFESPLTPKKYGVTKTRSVDHFGASMNLYDHVSDKGFQPSPRRGSDATVAFPLEPSYVKPGNASPVLPRRAPHATSNDITTCTYMTGDDVSSGARQPIFTDSYDMLGIAGSSNSDLRQDIDNELGNHYDVVVTQPSPKIGQKQKGGKHGYATTRTGLSGLTNPYENQKRTSLSLPFKNNRKMSLQPFNDEDAYDIVEVKESFSKLNPRSPKATPRTEASVGVGESKKSKAAIERSKSGPSLLGCAEFESVYVNTSRY